MRKSKRTDEGEKNSGKEKPSSSSLTRLTFYTSSLHASTALFVVMKKKEKIF
jgi:hypothetical protein